jgi:hypothetical protein
MEEFNNLENNIQSSARRKINKLSIIAFIFSVISPLIYIGFLPFKFINSLIYSLFQKLGFYYHEVIIFWPVILLTIGFIFAIISFFKIKKRKEKGVWFSIVSLIISIPAMIFLYSLAFNNFLYTQKELNKLNSTASVDHCINNFYDNDYLGISLVCPDGLMAQEGSSGIHLTYKEAVNFITKEDKINIRKKNAPAFFSIRLIYQKFNIDEHYELYFPNDSSIKQKEIYNFIKKAEAMTGPTRFEIKNIKEVYIEGNKYYSYSYMYLPESKNSRLDVFIIPKDDSYIKFTFSGQSEDFIYKVLSSVKINNNREKRHQNIKNEVIPIVESYLKKIGGLNCRGMSIYDKFSSDCRSYINLDKTTFNISEDENVVTVDVVVDFKGEIKRWDLNLEKYEDWEPLGSNHFNYKLIKKDGVFQITEGTFFNLKN